MASAPLDALGPAQQQGQQAVNAALASAKTMLGKNEVPNRSEIIQYLHDGGQDLDPHQVAWCAAFVSASLQKAGLPVPTQVVKGSAFGPGAYAPNYLTYGSAVNPKDIQAGDILVNNNGSHVGFAEGSMRQGPNGPEVQMLAGNDRDTSGQYAPGSYTSPTGAVANRAQVGMVGETWVPLSQYSARRYVPTGGQGGSAAAAAAPAPIGTTINTTTPQPSALSLSPTDRDYVIRTVAAEADHPGGDAAVASVIRNRLQDGQWGGTAKSVVQYPGQFSAWNKVTGYAGGAGGNDLVNISSDSPTYQRIGGIVDDVFSGKTSDPTKGALNFYAPGGMKGGQAPGWWSQVSNPIRIGAQWYGTAPGENQRVTGAPLATTPPVASAAPTSPSRPVTPTPPTAYPAGTPGAPTAVASATPQPFDWATQMQPAAKGQAPTLADDVNKMFGKGQGQGQQGADQIRAPAMNMPPPFVHREDPSTAYMNYGTTLNSMGAQMPPRSPLTGNPMGASSGGVLSPGLPGYQPIGAQLSGISPYAMMQFGPGALGMQSGGINMGQQGQQQDLYALMGAGGGLQ